MKIPCLGLGGANLFWIYLTQSIQINCLDSKACRVLLQLHSKPLKYFTGPEPLEFNVLQHPYFKLLDVKQYIEKLLNTADTVLFVIR